MNVENRGVRAKAVRKREVRDSAGNGVAMGPERRRSTLPTGAAKRVAEKLGRAIVGGYYEPESLLPVEAELQAEIGVGRNTLREAVKVLAGKGLLRTARHVGTRVCPRTEWNLMDPDVLEWMSIDKGFARRLMVDLTEIRSILEPAAAALAATRATTSEIEEMARFANMIDESMEEYVLEGDAGLHETIYRATHNLAMEQVGKAIVGMLRQHFWTEAKDFNRYWGNPEEHLELVGAIAERDAKAAARIANKLLDVNRERSNIQQNGKDSKEE